MSVYRLSAQVIGRSTGRSATGAAAYRAGIQLTDERTGLTHDYTRKGGVQHSEILAPAEAPAWMRDRAQLWNGVEAAEKRKDAQLAREVLLNLPHELDNGQRLELVRDFVQQEFVALGMVADVAIHAPHHQGDDRNHHAHVMLTMRTVTAEGFGPKARDWNSSERLEHWRETWAQHQNRALERAGRSERVDHRSLEARGLDREPEPKQGPVATRLEQQGKPSKAGDDRRAVQARNAERERLEHRAEVIDLAMARQARDRSQGAEACRVESEKGRFEAWANARRAELQNTRLEAEGRLGSKHFAERQALKEGQAATYGRDERRLLDQLATIKARQERSRGLRGILYRLSGRSAADAERVAGLQATLGTIRQRMTEQAGALRLRQDDETRRLHAACGDATTALDAGIQTTRDRREAAGWAALSARTQGQGEQAPQAATREPGEGQGTDPTATPEFREAYRQLSARMARGRDQGGRER